ncbi:SDR family NAD(P)-dependent oxidoreductase [Streptomyces halobius]|uniref:SDR family NAD(P)-dependent oxidoreductase n=2 Tax=Streptomyces halobius TaxID=2879846 RepID=A0ABY4MJY4_9ACTN|nr:SDR family NAD(P)-dependent oxidoreductase [Streptomyces halobius]
MARELLEKPGAFAERMEECRQILADLAGWDLFEVLGDAQALARTDVVQPALCAVNVSLAAWWRAQGMVPDAVVGHSQGEIAAAYVAGALGLEDVLSLSVARSRAIGRLPAGSGMVTVNADAERITPWLTGDLVIAAFNSPSNTVISGPDGELEVLLARAEAEGVWARRIEVAYASHHPSVDAIADELLAWQPQTAPRASKVAFHSTVTGTELDTAQLTAQYWLENLRSPVRFATTVAELAATCDTFIEISPHPTLTTGLEQILEAAGHGEQALILPSLVREADAEPTLLLHRASAWAHGHTAPLPTPRPGRHVELPPHPFTHTTYWLTPTTAPTPHTHPVLDDGTLIASADAETPATLFTGTVDDQRLPWAADHSIGGTPVLPAVAFLDFAWHAGEQVGAPSVAELVLHAPLALSGPATVQVLVRPADTEDHWNFEIHSVRAADSAGPPFLRHASGVLTPSTDRAAYDTWDTEGAQPLDADAAYQRAGERGYEYGPAFTAVRALWRAEDEILAELALPAELHAEFGAGQAPTVGMLDAALQPIAFGLFGDESGLRLPFTFTDVELVAPGAEGVLRTRVRAVGPDTFTVLVSDTRGRLVARIGEVRVREAEVAELRAAVDRPLPLHAVRWLPVTPTPGEAADDRLPRLLDLTGGDTTTDTSTDPVERTRALLAEALAAVQEADGERLLVVTRRAVAAGTEDDDAFAGAIDPAGAAVWGLVRSAQSELPDRLILADSEDGTVPPPEQALALARAGFAQLAHRAGRWLRPAVTELTPTPATAPRHDAGTALPRQNADQDAGTALITGGTGTVGGHIARHLVAVHGVRHLLLVSRSGPDAEGAAGLAAELSGLGAEVRIERADVGDRARLAELIDSVGEEHPLTTVVHTAGILDDATVQNLDAARIDTVLAPKAAAAQHLHDLTEHLPLISFVLLSSLAGLLGTSGQAGYAAANSYVDALAHNRHAAGLPAVSVALGLWGETSALTAQLDEAGRRRLTELGLRPMQNEAALGLFDRALASGAATVVAADLDLKALSRSGHPLAQRPQPRVEAGRQNLRAELLALEPRQQLTALTERVTALAARVLRSAPGELIEPDVSFKELGFDSLTAVEFRNAIGTELGFRLPPTVVFDHPTPRSMAEALQQRLAEDSGDGDRARTPTSEPAPAKAPSDEPLAIVGMACRYPGGAESPEALWQLVLNGTDAIGEFPRDRGWNLTTLFSDDPDRPGTSTTRNGGFLYDAAQFDAEFFGIAPTEALAMDPQQRLLLELTWESFEHAGVDPQQLRGTDCGVYVGLMAQDYGGNLSGSRHGLDGYLLSGNTPSVASGRLAYTFGFSGPAVTVDTACSSSLVALHTAAGALRAGECRIAVVGAATVMSSPQTFTEFSRQRGLAADGRCKAYSAAADGTGWSEGAGVVLVQRLSDALADGNPVLALVRGTAVNQDGQSNGLTAPNGSAQRRVIERTLAAAGLGPAEVDVLEGHGTGTRLGDPIEAGAIIEAYGVQRQRPLLLGSLKSNIGHTQAAAGLGGVIKMVMAMRAGIVPKSLHIDEPSPHVAWDGSNVSLLTENQPWPQHDRQRRVAVSSFGASGTNAHVILEQAPESAGTRQAQGAPGTEDRETDRPAEATGTEGAATVLPLSARSDSSLREQAARLIRFLEAHPDAPLGDITWTLTRHRAQHRLRAVVTSRGLPELRSGLAAVAAGQDVPGVFTGTAAEGRLAFLFTGQGSQRAQMGADLMAASPVFARALRESCEAFDGLLDAPLLDVIMQPDDPRLHRTLFAQPALFALERALFVLASAAGLVPDAVAGHSLGELTAAHVAGVFDLAAAARLIAARAAAMDSAAARGGMASVRESEAEVAERIRDYDGRLSIAAVNGPASVVVSGDLDAVEDLLRNLADEGVRTKRLKVSHAFHSAHMDAVLDEFRKAARSVTYHEPRIPLVSNASGSFAGAADLTDPEYWVRHVRGTVRFGDAIDTLAASGHRHLLELGPDGALTGMVEERGESVTAVAALSAKHPELASLVDALAAVHVAGRTVDWTALTGTGNRIDLPTYGFTRQHYWASAEPDTPSAGPLLDQVVEVASTDTVVGQVTVDAQRQPWLNDHLIHGSCVLPGTYVAALVSSVGQEAGCPVVEELTLHTPAVCADRLDVQVAVTAGQDAGRRKFTVSVRDRAGGPWSSSAEGTVRPDTLSGAQEETAPALGADAAAVPAEAIVDGYARLAGRGYHYGPAFRALRTVRTAEGRTEAELVVPEGTVSWPVLAPALLDAALHPVILGLLPGLPADDDTLWAPFTWENVRLAGATPAPGSVLHARLDADARPGEVPAVSAEITTETGEHLATVGRVTLRALRPDQLAASHGAARWEIRAEAVDTPPLAGSAAVHAVGFDSPLSGGNGEEITLVDARAAASGDDPVRATHEAVRTASAALREALRAQLPVVVLVPDPEADGALAGSAVAGLARAAQAEHPGRIVLLAADDDAASLAQLPAAVTVRDGREWLLRRGRWYRPVLHRSAPPTAVGPVWPDPQELLLITGAGGGIGRQVARWAVAEWGARNLLLLSRRGEGDPVLRELAEELRTGGATVEVVACDLTEQDAVQSVFAAHPVRGVLHTAGVLADSTLDAMTDDQLHRVLAAKADAAWHLHRAAGENLRTFVLFSSLAGAFGSAGQANYSSANAFLDALARHRADRGLPATSIQWGLWGGSDGMAGTLSQQELASLAEDGILPMEPHRALAALDTVLADEPAPTVVVAALNPSAASDPRTAPAPIAPLLRTAADHPDDVPQLDLGAYLPAERPGVVLDLVRRTAARVLGHTSISAVPADRGFLDLGFDSLAAVKLRNQLAQSCAVALPNTVVFDCPTPAELAAYVTAELDVSEQSDEDSESGGPPGLAEASDEELFAIVDGGATRS